MPPGSTSFWYCSATPLFYRVFELSYQLTLPPMPPYSCEDKISFFWWDCSPQYVLQVFHFPGGIENRPGKEYMCSQFHGRIAGVGPFNVGSLLICTITAFVEVGTTLLLISYLAYRSFEAFSN